MTDDELAAVVAELGREPTTVELAMYAVMWSEHCSYKSSRTYLGRFPTEAPWVLVGPGEGAGVVDIGDGIAIAIRIESHNHPSAVEPYQGAATGVGGIIRDIFSMGARPIALMDPLRFGSLDDARTRYLFEGVVSGISGYGNSVGVPTVGGEVVFDDTYRDNPLVNVLCLGILPTERLVLARAEGAGNLAVLLGSATGRDGIGGASVLASAGFEEGGEAKRPSVQVGDPFEEKRLIEACLELLDRRLAIGVQDLGAAGLSCAASETAAKGGVGMDVDVARVAKREPGMNAVEVLTSESQERMLAIVEPAQLEAVLELARRWEIRATVVGRVTDSGRFRVFDGLFDAIGVPGENPRPPLGDTRTTVELRPRTGRRRAGRQPRRRAVRTAVRLRARPPRTSSRPTIRAPSCARSSRPAPTWARELLALARDADDRRQDVGVAPVRPSAVPEHRCGARRRRRGAAGEGHAEGARARDRRQGALLPARPAHRRPARRARSGAQRRDCTGARPLALVNCLNFGEPRAPRGDVAVLRGRRGHERGVRGARHPGGRRERLLLQRVARRRHPSDARSSSVLGLIDELPDAPPGPALSGGDSIVVLGATRPELGGSEWAAVVHGSTGGMPPVADLDARARLHEFVAEIVVDREVTGVHDVSDGGLAVALAEMAFAGEVGFKVDLTTDGCTAAEACFAESTSRVSCSPSRATASPRSSVARSPRVCRPRWSATREAIA